jgi:hypothetical protein
MSHAAQPSTLDRYGVLLSLLCLAHCLALPALFALLPAAASLLPSNFWIHAILFGLALPVSGWALWLGYRRHGRLGPLGVGTVGLVLIFAGLVAPDVIREVALTVSGGLLVVSAHAFNRRRVS